MPECPNCIYDKYLKQQWEKPDNLAVQDLEATKERRDTVRAEVHAEDESAEVWEVSIDFEML